MRAREVMNRDRGERGGGGGEREGGEGGREFAATREEGEGKPSHIG